MFYIKNNSIKWTIAAILIFSEINVYATSRDSIELQVHFQKQEIVNSKDLIIDIQIKSNKIRPLIFLKDPSPNFVARHMGALRVEVQSKVGDKYVDLPVHGTIDNMPVEVDTLYSGNSRTYQLALGVFYRHLLKGNYRVRILAAFSLLNPKVKDQYSEWVYFNCDKDIID
jgi:hypothetical protein